MAHAGEIRKDMQRSTNPVDIDSPHPAARAWKAERRVSREQEQADYAAWLREYRRWTQSGSCAPTRTGEIEWGGEHCDRAKA
jgi:hypothetical protein